MFGLFKVVTAGFALWCLNQVVKEVKEQEENPSLDLEPELQFQEPPIIALN